MESKSQKQLIKEHLIKRNTITPIEALNKFGCFRLAARISELRDEGMNIKTDTKEGYAVYSYEKYEGVEYDSYFSDENY